MGFLRKHLKFITYAICGVLATLVNSATYWLFTDGLNVNLPAFFATAIAWAISVLFAFITNKLFVFKSKSFRPIVLLSEFSSFVLARLGTGLLDIGIMSIFVDVLKLAQSHDILDDCFKLVSTMVVTLLNYFISEYLVFRKKHVHHFARILMAEGVEYYACIPLSKCKITKPYLLYKNGIDKNANVIVMLFPYRTRAKADNLTAYASVKDYHAYVEMLSNKLERYILRKYPTAQFKVFADHSPIDEVHAACVSGLGFMGDNGLLINEKYSSFVFVGECITSLTPKQLGLAFAEDEEMRTCLHCGKCEKVCPSGCIKIDDDGKDASNKGICLSAITQKKGELSESEKELILKNGSIWGCDACQNACPYTKNAKYTPIKYFIDSAITRLDIETLNGMSSDEFNSRPFAWRGLDTIKRNVLLWEDYTAQKRREAEEKARAEAEENAKIEADLKALTENTSTEDENTTDSVERLGSIKDLAEDINELLKEENKD